MTIQLTYPIVHWRCLMRSSMVWKMTKSTGTMNSVLTVNYHKIKYDTAYIMRPQSKWTVMARLNVSGALIETEGIDQGQYYQSEMEANSKATLSLGVGYQGLTLSRQKDELLTAFA